MCASPGPDQARLWGSHLPRARQVVELCQGAAPLCEPQQSSLQSKFRSRLTATLIHTHVERTVETETESAIGLVDLGGGHADIEQRAVNLIYSQSAHRFANLTESATHCRKARVADRICRGNRRRIAIQGD
ncbi:conserved hypothetical protein [Ricinus communis]|uniref:Uncharacterized protein n=1 Tax=Ricinus communis TaxID=3988 RepID=B9T9B9_RICCO|nr:conserved hypothetical protein [Ricinus communis]